MMPKDKPLSDARRAYEQKRASKAGKSLDAWLNEKRKLQAESAKPVQPPAPAKKPGLLSRILDRAHKPL
jgi:hypothetical protein